MVVSHGDFLESAQSLSALRRRQGWSVAVVDVEDLYDEHNFGGKSPWAIRDFLGRAQDRWEQPPRFVLLVGDAGFDPRNYLGVGDFDFLPTKRVETNYWETASDDWFADFDNAGLSQVAIGRIPVRTAAEAAAVVAKIIAYEHAETAGPTDPESAPWFQRVLLAADNNDVFDFEEASVQIAPWLPAGIAVDGVFLSWLDPAVAKAELLGHLNEGQLLVNYFGHGSVEVWAEEGLLHSSDAHLLANSPRLPVVVSMTCLNGLFHDLVTECLAEALLKAENGGAVAVWASSGLTIPVGQLVLDWELIRHLFGPDLLTLGEAIVRAKSAVADEDIRRTWVLLGDPATRLR